ncbi:diacylglycerol kinase family protein [Peribacillus asahii]|uniref:Diacylglycerol kinase family protein n=1 Tax=Peribacillus asahii TaxID=228899 RepID=A0A398BG98_9BACI|nr:diacylglycerol kinase family protein [Peribacillus asahii]RID89459.1 diacylglycerol kinase family protein [Peribacillus asahii]
MSTDYREKRKYPFVKSFYFALRGIWEGVKTERNIRIHSMMTVVVILLGTYVSLNWIEWLFVLIAVTGTVALELVNSALERVVDLVTEEYHPLARQAKDMAAAAVLLYAVFSVIVGIVIFLPKLIST